MLLKLTFTAPLAAPEFGPVNCHVSVVPRRGHRRQDVRSGAADDGFDVAEAHIGEARRRAGIRPRQLPLLGGAPGGCGVIDDEGIGAAAALEHDRGRGETTEGIQVDGHGVVGRGLGVADNTNLFDLREISDRQNLVVVGQIDHLDALDGLGGAADLNRRVDHLDDEIVVLVGQRRLRQIDGEHVGAQQQTRFQGIEQQLALRVRTAAPDGGRTLAQSVCEAAAATIATRKIRRRDRAEGKCH